MIDNIRHMGNIGIILEDLNGQRRIEVKNTISKAGKNMMRHLATTLMFTGYSSNPIDKQACNIPGFIFRDPSTYYPKFGTPDDVCNFYVLNLTSNFVIDANTKYLPILTSTGELDTSRLIGYGNTRATPSDVKEGDYHSGIS